MSPFLSGKAIRGVHSHVLDMLPPTPDGGVLGYPSVHTCSQHRGVQLAPWPCPEEVCGAVPDLPQPMPPVVRLSRTQAGLPDAPWWQEACVTQGLTVSWHLGV